MKNAKMLIAVFLLCLSPLSFAGKIYKWTDSDGNIHYGERPPGPQAKQLKVPRGPASRPTTAAKPASTQDATKKLLDAFDKERKDKQAAAEKATKEKERRDKNCSNARRRVAGLKVGGRIYEVDEQGERHYLGEADIQKRVTEAQKQVDKWCN